MGTAVAKRSIWAVIAENPFPYFDAETFRAGVAARLQAYAERVGGSVSSPPLRTDAREIFRLHLSDLPFPDGPGRGSLEVVAYKAFGRLYLSARFEHDRLFQALDGSPGSRLYLHDYTFIRSYADGCTPVLREVDEALEGLETARLAVQRRNRANAGGRSPFARIRVTLASVPDADLHGSPAENEPSAPASPEAVARRKEVLDAIRAEEKRPGPVRIRRRRSDDQGPEAA